jgi:UPF0755 protein
MKKQQEGNKPMKWFIRFIVALLLIAAVSVLGYMYVQYTLSSPPRTKPVEVEVSQGDSIMQVGTQLEKKKLIRDDLFFAAYAMVKGQAKALKPGVYEIPPGTDVNGILDIFSHAKNNVMRLTIPEGYTVDQIAEELQKKRVDKEAFYRAVNQRTYRYPFLRQINSSSKRKYLLEGYLYPSTYNLSKNTDPEKLVDKMLDQFQQEMDREQVLQKLKAKNMTVDEWVTIASIVEREGQVKDELPRIAGVIYNRLKTGRKLQVDATVQYALGKQKERLYFKDLKVRSPYNTYLYPGLPPGPISNPGKQALEAALNPEKHQYFFYVTRKDGSGRHYFARTEAEHQRNILRSKQEARQTPSQGQPSSGNESSSQ